jgi:hypothetical protein
MFPEPNDNDNFCLNGQWYHWAEMTSQQKAAKKAAKLTIASATGDEAMEQAWFAVQTGE